MALRVDLTSGMSWIPSVLVVITALIATFNYMTNAVQLTVTEAAGLAAIITILTAIATFLTSVESNA
jgi:hypothetical protein